MKATIKQTSQMALLVKELWSEHTVEDLERILQEYIGGNESAVFTDVADGQPIGVALCCLRHDYVEGCATRYGMKFTRWSMC